MALPGPGIAPPVRGYRPRARGGGPGERPPPAACDSDPLVLREIRPPFELTVHGPALGEDPHARGELLDHAAVVTVPGAHTDPVEASEHVEFRHREAREAIHTDRHPKHDEVEPPNPSRTSG